MEFSYKKRKCVVDAYDETDVSSFGRIVNHCKKHRNATVRCIELDGCPQLLLVARRDIDIGEQIFIDYGPHYEHFEGFLDCPCSEM